MRRTATASAGRPRSPGVKRASVKRSGAQPTLDEKDEYIVNLKGQIYLLSIENEMLKKTVSAPGLGASGAGPAGAFAGGASGFGAASMRSSTSMRGAGAAGGMGSPLGTSALLSSALPPAEYPTEIGDAFEVMRQKYTQLEHKYQHDLEEARRGAEALASQCAAQSSLIGTLKKEVAAGAAVLSEQKQLVQRVEAKAAADLERAQRDIAHLHARIEELNGEKAGLQQHVAALGDVIADLKSAAAAAAGEARAAEAARTLTLDAYARNLLTARYLLRRWKQERAAKLAAGAAFDKARGEKAAAERRALRGEAEAERERAASAALAALHANQLEVAREERAALGARIEELEAALGEVRGELGLKGEALDTLGAQLPQLHGTIQLLQAALAKAEGQREAALARGGALERLLTAKAEEAEALRGAAVAAEERQAGALAQLRATEDALAGANARVAALETTEADQAKAVAGLTGEVEALAQGKATAEAEITTLRDELSRRPPIDVIKELDVENLLQRNMQAAAAMHQLLAWQAAHAPQPVAAGLQAPPGDVPAPRQ